MNSRNIVLQNFKFYVVLAILFYFFINGMLRRCFYRNSFTSSSILHRSELGKKLKQLTFGTVYVVLRRSECMVNICISYIHSDEGLQSETSVF